MLAKLFWIGVIFFVFTQLGDCGGFSTREGLSDRARCAGGDPIACLDTAAPGNLSDLPRSLPEAGQRWGRIDNEPDENGDLHLPNGMVIHSDGSVTQDGHRSAPPTSEAQEPQEDLGGWLSDRWGSLREEWELGR
jgi:hypothetical protein